MAPGFAKRRIKVIDFHAFKSGVKCVPERIGAPVFKISSQRMHGPFPIIAPIQFALGWCTPRNS